MVSYIKQNHSTRMSNYRNNEPRPLYPPIPEFDKIPRGQPVDDGNEKYAKIIPKPFQPIVPTPEYPSTPQVMPPYAPNSLPKGNTHNHRQMYRPAPPGKYRSRLICNQFHANKIMFIGVILWVISVIGYAIPDIYINGIAAGVNFISYIFLLVPCCCGHPCCDHEDHSCCYGEYD